MTPLLVCSGSEQERGRRTRISPPPHVSTLSRPKLSQLFLLITLLFTPAKALFENIGPDNGSLISRGSANPYLIPANRPIANANGDADYYRSNRYGADFTYTLTGLSPNQRFQLQLGFAETYQGACQRGARIFNVLVNGVLVVNSLDVFDKSGGCDSALVETINANASSSGKFDIRFQGLRNSAIVAWIRVSDSSSSSQESKWIDLRENESYTARHECSFVQAGNKFYLFGGRESPRKLEEYDFASNTWRERASVPSGQDINHFQATEFQGLIWVIGSYKDNRFPRETPSDIVLVYDPGNNVWIQGPSIPSNRRRGSAGLAVYQGKFYVLGGTTNGHEGGVVNWFDEYDPHTGAWRNVPDAPHNRDHFHSAVIGDKLYIVGGRRSSRSSNFNGDPVKEVDVYDFRSGRWLTSGLPDDLPIPRSGAAVAVFDGKVLIMGGETDLKSTAYKDVEQLDPATGKWSTLAPMNQARHGFQAIVSGQGVYVTAGSPVAREGRQKLMEVYNRDAPEGIASIAGVLSAPARVELQPRQSEDIWIRHTGGNEGIYIQSMVLLGSDRSLFRVVGMMNDILIDRNGQVKLTAEYIGTVNDAKARIVITYSGGQAKTIPLRGISQATNTNDNGFLLDAGMDDRSMFNDASSEYQVSSSVQIRDTSTPQYYRTQRWSPASFKYTLRGYSSSKTYEIKLGFAEIYRPTCLSGVGARVFNVKINGQFVELNLDVFAEKGCETALTKTYRAVPLGGIIEIELVKKDASNPFVSLIEINEASGSISPPGPVPPAPPPSNNGATIFINAGARGENESYIATSGTVPFSGSSSISGTQTPQYFQSHRYATKNFAYKIDSLDKSKMYSVELGFAELYDPNCVVGKRIFDIRLNGNTVGRNVDVFAAKGCRTAHTMNYDIQPNSDQAIEIEFIKRDENPMVSFIRIQEKAGTSTSETSSIFVNAGDTNERTSYIIDSDTQTSRSSVSVANTNTPQYFQSHRYSSRSFGYKFDGFDSSKTYTVELGFAEVYRPNCRNGSRVFGLQVNGNDIKSNIDVFASGGCETAYTISYNLRPSSSGSFVIQFIKRVENPMVSMIRINEIGGSSSPPPPPPPPPQPPSASPGAQVFFTNAGDSREDTSIVFPTTTMTYSIPSAFNIYGTNNPNYFRSHRYSSTSFGYKISGFDRNKTYKIDLWFAEQYTPNCRVGQRVFDIFVNGVKRKSDLDVFAAKGCETAHVESYSLKPSASGEFEVILSKKVENPMISYIEITEVGNSPPTLSPPPPPPTTAPTPASPSQSFGVNGFVLVNADTNQDIPGGLDYNGSTQNFNIRVTVEGQDRISSVSIELFGPVRESRTEGVAPYSAFGDRNGNFLGKNLPPGRYVITAFATDSNGNKSPSYSRSFAIGNGRRFLRSRFR